jgi:hypothetical protein
MTVARGALVVAAAALVGLGVQSAPARAEEAGRVILLEPAAASAGARRCLTRVREELIAGGFDVALVDPGPRTDPVSMADAMERQRESVATIALLGDPEHGPAELWILDRVGGQAEVRRIPAPTEDPERVPEVLAIRTIEVLRASALKLLVESNRPPAPPPPPAAPTVVVAASAPARAAPPAPILGLETGISLLSSVGGPGPAAVPLARLRVPLRGPLSARVTLAGLGTTPHVDTTLGSAAVAQTLGLAELGLLFRAGRRVRPLVSVGGGVLHVQSDGAAMTPYLGNNAGRWAGVADGGVGVLFGDGGDLAAALELHAFLAFPHPVIRFVDVDAATIGRPSLMATLTLVAWL